MYDFRIKIADIPLRIRCLHQETPDLLRQYLTDEEECFTLEPSAQDLLHVQEDFDRSADAEGRPRTPYKDGYLELNAVHALLAEQLVQYDVLLVHGSALCMDGQAYIFTAKSGTGKSTHARLWREVFGERVWMINDDKPMLRISPEGITVWGTPWDGKHHLSRNACAPLKAVAQIRRSSENRITPMAKADAFPLLMQQTYSSADPATALCILKLQLQILDRIPFYILDCSMAPEAAAVALEGLSGKALP